LITETKNAYAPILSAFKNGWSITAKKRFPEFYAKREEISVQTDGIIMINDQILIPPCCRQEMLNHLHKSHLGRDKMKSLARLICWWPEINHDIVNFVRNCKRCAVKPSNHKNWKPWPTTMYPMQRIHADYCGPFLGKFYALVIEDSFSKFPEVFLTLNATADFTKQCLQKIFSREGIAQVLVTDNGKHFSCQNLQNWLKKNWMHSCIYSSQKSTIQRISGKL